MRKIIYIITLLFFLSNTSFAQKMSVTSISASIKSKEAKSVLDNNVKTGWILTEENISQDQFLMFTLETPSDLTEIEIDAGRVDKSDLQKLVSVFITYDPMNLGDEIKYTIEGNKTYTLKFDAKYGKNRF